LERFCLFIDDEDISDELEAFKDKAKRSGYKISCEAYNPNSDTDENLDLDLEKIVDNIKQEYKSRKIDIIACDYNFGDKEINGCEVAFLVRQFKKNSQILIYSGNIDTVLGDYFGKIDSKNKKQVFHKIKKLITSKIDDFIDRSDYLNHILGMLGKTSLELEIENQLIKYKDIHLTHGFENLAGKTFEEIAAHVSEQSPPGQRFIKELIDRGLCHMINLNSDEHCLR